MSYRAKAEVSTNRPSHVTKGSVLDDLGFSPDEALELKVKADIWNALLAHIESQGFSAEHLARELKVHQPDVSNLLNGKIGRFSVGRLIQFAARLDMSAEVTVTGPEPKANAVAKAAPKRPLVRPQAARA
jgi:predicted XRE-type DNA-binding protein